MTTMSDDEIRAALSHPDFSHSRAGTGLWRDIVWIYHRYPGSPSGVHLHSAAEFDRVVRIGDELRKPFPLSPHRKDL